MIVTLDGGYELDDDRDRVDLDVVWRYLSQESYWARGRTRDSVAERHAAAHRIVGLYTAGGTQVGYARVVSDGLSIAYLCDVFVLAEHRGDGRGTALVRETVDGGGLADVRWYLHTDDAHELYRKLGFNEPDRRAMERRSE